MTLARTDQLQDWGWADELPGPKSRAAYPLAEIVARNRDAASPHGS